MPRDKVILDGMEFYGYHGVQKAEHELGQPFIVDLELGLDLAPAGRSDDLRQAVNYVEVYNTVREIVQKGRFLLLEALAEAIASAVLRDFPVEELMVRVKKPHVPIPGRICFAAVEIKRQNEVKA
ncbi:MAG: dihydroneopterin aldolase [Desulforudis sp.]|jgi:dihydroneopterin aldolase|nr:MAG: dihydroneopterin aldolase [Desulforudis sp.]